VILRISAVTGKGTGRIVPAVNEVLEARSSRVPTPALNRLIQRVQEDHHAAGPGSGSPRIKYAVQGATDPPTFTFFATSRLTPGYLRYLENRIRSEFDLGPTPMKLRVRVKESRR
jgi:GTP-binding protein